MEASDEVDRMRDGGGTEKLPTGATVQSDNIAKNPQTKSGSESSDLQLTEQKTDTLCTANMCPTRFIHTKTSTVNPRNRLR